MAGAERFELSTRGFGGDVEVPTPRRGLPVCPRMRGFGTPAAPRIDAFLMMCGNLAYRAFKEEKGEKDLSFAYMRKIIKNGKTDEKEDNAR